MSLQAVVSGPGLVRERPFARSVVVSTAPPDPIARLSSRELDALRAICTSEDGRAAAASLFVGHQQLKNLLSSAFKKLGLTQPSRPKSARACYQLGLWEARRQ